MVVSTLKNGVTFPKTESICIPFVSMLEPSNLTPSVPEKVIPILLVSDLKNPVVFEVVSENVNDGGSPVPSNIFIFALSIDESAPLTVIPPLKVANPVNVDVEVTLKVPVMKHFQN